MDLIIDVAEVGQMVGGHMNLSSRYQGSMQGVDERGVEETMCLVSFLGPGIRKEDVVCGNGLRGDQVRHGVIGFEAQEPDIGQAGSYGFPVDFSQTPQHPIDSQKIGIGMLGGTCQQKPPFPTAQINFERLGPGKA